MKKVLFLLVFAGLAVAVLHSCRKDGLDSRNPEPQQKTYTAQEMQIWRSLTNFNNKVKNGLRDEEFISPDSAMWYLEALINATEATDTTFNDFSSYERTYTLTINENGTVNLSDVTAIYNQMLADLEYELNQLPQDYKFFIVGDLEEESTRDGSFTMDFSGGIGYDPLSYYEPISSNDNWRSGNMNGKCTNTQWDSDGGIQLKTRFNNPDFPWTTPPGNTWIDIVPSNVLTYEQFPGRIFHEVATSDPCMEYTELQNYLTEGHYLIYNTSTETPVGVRPIGKSFISMVLWTNDEPASLYLHYYQITYGVHVNIPPIE